jgi:hypothetical protein
MRTYLKIDFVAKRREKLSGEAAGEKAPEAYCTNVEELFSRERNPRALQHAAADSDFEIGSNKRGSILFFLPALVAIAAIVSGTAFADSALQPLSLLHSRYRSVYEQGVTDLGVSFERYLPPGKAAGGRLFAVFPGFNIKPGNPDMMHFLLSRLAETLPDSPEERLLLEKLDEHSYVGRFPVLLARRFESEVIVVYPVSVSPVLPDEEKRYSRESDIRILESVLVLAGTRRVVPIVHSAATFLGLRMAEHPGIDPPFIGTPMTTLEDFFTRGGRAMRVGSIRWTTLMRTVSRLMRFADRILETRPEGLFRRIRRYYARGLFVSLEIFGDRIPAVKQNGHFKSPGLHMRSIDYFLHSSLPEQLMLFPENVLRGMFFFVAAKDDIFDPENQKRILDAFRLSYTVLPEADHRFFTARGVERVIDRIDEWIRGERSVPALPSPVSLMIETAA